MRPFTVVSAVMLLAASCVYAQKYSRVKKNARVKKHLSTEQNSQTPQDVEARERSPAQQAASSSAMGVQETVTVVGSAEPLIAAEPSRSVESMEVQVHPALIPDAAGYLRNDASVDIQMRGPMGVQSDIAVRGSTFEQTLVLLNGLRINDAQTSHFNLDLPVPMFTLGKMDVLHGAGSTLYGSDSIGGTVDVRTARAEASSLRLRAGVGSYGINRQSVVASGVRGRMSEILSGARDFSTGFIQDRDYRSESAASESRISARLGESDVLLAMSDRAYGADQFYGNYASWERTKGWFAALTQELGKKTSLAVAYRRHTDWYVLTRSNPAAYANNHIDTSWQAILRRRDTFGRHATLFTGLDNNLDQVDSNNLGKHGRNRSAGYGTLDLRWRHAALSAGLREEGIGGYGVVSSPGFNGSVWLRQRLKARGSVGYGFRLPTYTDKYYSDPTTLPNPGLRPESAWSYDGGLDWYPNDRVVVSAGAFVSRQSNAIDYVRSGSTGKYQARNLTSVRLVGPEISMQARIGRGQSLRLSYTGVTGAQSALGNLQSRGLFNFPTHNASAEWIASVKQVAVRGRVGAAQRIGRNAYATVDLSAARETGLVRPFLQMTNLTNTGYEEISGVRMQGRAFVGGLEFVLGGKR